MSRRRSDETGRVVGHAARGLLTMTSTNVDGRPRGRIEWPVAVGRVARVPGERARLIGAWPAVVHRGGKGADVQAREVSHHSARIAAGRRGARRSTDPRRRRIRLGADAGEEPQQGPGLSDGRRPRQGRAGRRGRLLRPRRRGGDRRAPRGLPEGLPEDQDQLRAGPDGGALREDHGGALGRTLPAWTCSSSPTSRRPSTSRRRAVRSSTSRRSTPRTRRSTCRSPAATSPGRGSPSPASPTTARR